MKKKQITHVCKDCKFHKIKWFNINRNRCINPKVLEVQHIKLGFCNIALMWPCTNGKLKDKS